MTSHQKVVCSTCSQRFPNTQKLKKHVEEKHTLQVEKEKKRLSELKQDQTAACEESFRMEEEEEKINRMIEEERVRAHDDVLSVMGAQYKPIDEI